MDVHGDRQRRQDNAPTSPNKQGVSGQDLANALENLVRSRFAEGLVGQLEANYESEGTSAEDAVADALSSMLRYADSLHVDEPAAHSTASASNALRKALKRKRQHEDVEYEDREGYLLHISEEFGKRLFELAKSIIDGWENADMAAVTLYVIEATFVSNTNC